MLIETHAHLDYPDFAADFEEVLQRATAVGVTRIITIGTSVESSRRAVDLAEAHENIYADSISETGLRKPERIRIFPFRNPVSAIRNAHRDARAADFLRGGGAPPRLSSGSLLVKGANSKPHLSGFAGALHSPRLALRVNSVLSDFSRLDFCLSRWSAA